MYSIYFTMVLLSTLYKLKFNLFGFGRLSFNRTKCVIAVNLNPPISRFPTHLKIKSISNRNVINMRSALLTASLLIGATAQTFNSVANSIGRLKDRA